MKPPIEFSSKEAYQARSDDVSFWQPWIEDSLRRHDLFDEAAAIVAGVGGTFPTFICGEVVIKFFGHFPWWRKSFDSEYAGNRALGADPELAVPRLLSWGRLFDHPDAPWPYLVTTFLPYKSWQLSELTPDEKRRVAGDLGRQVARVQKLRPEGVAAHEDWLTLNVTETVRATAFPNHLTAQIDDYLARLNPFDRVVVHGDLMGRHVLVDKGGRLAGIIDWGDTMLTDRHYELAKLHLDLFDCDRTLLKAFLDGSNWEIGRDFARMAMGLALYRQAHCAAQHASCDVFYKLPHLYPLDSISTLDELAAEVFRV